MMMDDGMMVIGKLLLLLLLLPLQLQFSLPESDHQRLKQLGEKGGTGNASAIASAALADSDSGVLFVLATGIGD